MLTTEQIENKLLEADKAFGEWRKVAFEEKQELLAKAAQLLLDKSEEYGKIITREMNKPISQSIAEIEKCALMMNYYAKAENILKPEEVKTKFNVCEVHHTPMGVILGVMPWNYPFWQVLRFAVPALLAGNTVVVKHASICFESGYYRENIKRSRIS